MFSSGKPPFAKSLAVDPELVLAAFDLIGGGGLTKGPLRIGIGIVFGRPPTLIFDGS